MTGVIFGLMDALIFMSSYLYFNSGFTIGNLNAFNSYMFGFLINFAILAAISAQVMALQGVMAGIA